MLAATGIRLGDNYWLILGPVLVALALVIWLVLTIRASRHAVPHTEPDPEETDHERGPVRGGIIEGDPGQRNRRD